MTKTFSIQRVKLLGLLLIALGALIPAILKADPAPAERMLNLYNGAEPEYLDPGIISGTVEHHILVDTFEGLTTYNPKDSTPVAGVANGWKVSPDGLVYTFSLRKEAKWSDGTPVTAQDFEYAWKRVLKPETASKSAFLLYYVKNGEAYNQGKIKDPNLVGVKALNDTTLQVTLEYPAPFFLGVTANAPLSPVKKSVVEKFGDKWVLPGNMVSNGAYMLKAWTPLKEVVIVKNPYYWNKANVKIGSVRYFPLEDRDTAIKKFDVGELDTVYQLPGIRVPAMSKRPDFMAFPTNAVYYYEFNTKKPPFNNPKLRQAVAMAMDRNAITKFIMQGGEKPSGHMVPDGMPGYKSVGDIPFDVARAKKLLVEAGYPTPDKVPPIEIVYNTDLNHKRLAEAVQQMLKQNLGITVALRNMEWKSYLKARTAGDFQIARAGWVGDYLDPYTFLEIFKTGSSTNYSGWSNKQYDELLEQANRELNPAKRMELMAQAEKILLDEAPVSPTHIYTDTWLVNPKLKGFYGNLINIHPVKNMWWE